MLRANVIFCDPQTFPCVRPEKVGEASEEVSNHPSSGTRGGSEEGLPKVAVRTLGFQFPSHVCLFETPCTAACQATLAMRCPRQEYWNGLPFPSPGDLPYPGIEFRSPASPFWQTDSLPLSHLGSVCVRSACY